MNHAPSGAGINDAFTKSEQPSNTVLHANSAPMPRQQIAGLEPTTRETSLYSPVKGFLETLGFDVKGEICGCDLVALRGGEPPIVVIGELKLGFNLELILQGINRTAACDEIWLAVRASARRSGRERDPRVRKLCRLLGFGLLGVSATGRVEVLVEPGPWRPRRDPKRRSRLVSEHRRRLGDPALGGTSKLPIMTAYRQQALACAASLSNGPRRTSDIKATLPEAPKILLRNVYGWFARVERGIYALTQEGVTALSRWPQTDRRDEPACDRMVPILHDDGQFESKRLRDDPTIDAAKRRASHRAGDHPAGSR